MKYKINLNREKLSKAEISQNKDFDQFFSDYYKTKLYGKGSSGNVRWISRFWLGVLAGTLISISAAWLFWGPETVNFYISLSSDTLRQKNNPAFKELMPERTVHPEKLSAADTRKSAEKQPSPKSKKQKSGKDRLELGLNHTDNSNPAQRLLEADTVIMRYMLSLTKSEGICLCEHCRKNDPSKNELYIRSLYNKEFSLNSGKEVLLETTGKISTGILSQHQFIHFKVKENIKVGNETIIAEGSMLSGEVIELTEAKKPAKELFIKLKLTAVDCHPISEASHITYQLLLIKQKGTEIPLGSLLNAFVTAKVNPRTEDRE